MIDLINRQTLMKEFSDFVRRSNNSDFAPAPTWNDAVSLVKSMPFVQSEITDEQAILHLQSTGWMQNHDREMYEMGLKEQLKDGKGDCTGCNFQGWYDTDFPCVNCVRKIKDYYLSAERR